MGVTVIRNEAHFQSEIAKASAKLVVVDFTATWCPPCKRIAPFFEQLPAKFPRAVFLKVDVDRCAEVASAQGISAMPTFMFFRYKTRIDRLQGADTVSLENKVRQHYGTDNTSGGDVAGHSNNSEGKMPPSKEDILRQFCDVTGADDNRSKFFLESSNWQLDVALSSFYEHGGTIEEAANPQLAAALPQQLSDSDMESPPRSPSQPKKKDKKQPSFGFATLDSLHQDSSSEEEVPPFGRINQREETVLNFFCYTPTCSKKKEKSNSENSRESDTKKLNEALEEIKRLKNEIDRLSKENSKLKDQLARFNTESGEAFYAGGSERSGQQILGPGKGRKDIVTEMFKSVRERGAVVFDEEQSSSSRGRGGVFSGVGYRLGQTADDHEEVTPGRPPGQLDNQPRAVRLQLYREGFSVDGGPLRQYSVPDNAEFLSCIRRGEIPAELSGRGEVRLSLEDRRHEDCSRAAPRHQAFSGKGHLLGSPTPATVGATVAVAASSDDREANQRAAQAAVSLDETSPVTTVQFRLADGSRLTGRFNHSHTVADLVQYVSRAEPAYQLQTFALLTSFPSTELTDRSATLAQANLLNTTLLQRLK